MNFVEDDELENEMTPLDVLAIANFFKGVSVTSLDRDMPVSFILLADDENKSVELLDLDICTGCFIEELEEAMYEKNWRPIAVEFCEDEEDDFDCLGIYFFSDNPSDQDMDLINSMFVQDPNNANVNVASLVVKNDNLIDLDKEVIITCPQHGDFWQKPIDHLKGYGCPHPDCVKSDHEKNKIDDTDPKSRFVEKNDNNK